MSHKTQIPEVGDSVIYCGPSSYIYGSRLTLQWVSQDSSTWFVQPVDKSDKYWYWIKPEEFYIVP